MSDSAVGRRVAAGRLHRVHVGVYAVGHAVLGPHGQWTAAVLGAGPTAALSHDSAAALWALRPYSTRRCHVTVPGTGRRSSRLLRVHRTVAFAATDVTVRHGIRVTTPARTILDLAASLDRRSLERLLDRAELERLTDRPALEAAIDRWQGHHGVGALGRVLREHTAGTTVTKSQLEERMLALCRAHGLPRPLVNHPVEGIEVDFVFGDARLLVEADSWTHHRSRDAFERDRERDAIFARAGYRVLRFTDRGMRREPAVVAATIRGLLT